ncbi:hypothetical protein SLOPH_1700 [Spraguea lophii 42_110]|uniref:SLC41A/MgtE integral membrane domain-containing protein n=1 Tax=Spraguea lophii (strain 42_110) TaxID=1358809 RepID=S7W9G5_SPRLO|nr:hypothetical protein SLOPH_1700 [Spraguea lophii 42_110]
MSEISQRRRKLYNKSIIVQSIPSLIISLIGLMLVGQELENAITDKLFTVYPILLLETCILTFKGNIELIFSMNLSSMLQILSSFSEYSQYAIENGCLVIFQSTVIGISIGLIGASGCILIYGISLLYSLRVIIGCVITCLMSTVFVLLILVISLYLSHIFHVNSDNFILPLIAVFSDYLSTILLVYFLRVFYTQSLLICLLCIFFISLVLLLTGYISVKSKMRIPSQSWDILVITYLFSSIGGFAIEYFSKYYPILAGSSYVFCGISGSSSYIYLNRRITSLHSNSRLDKRATFISLLIISLVVSLFYIFIQFLFKSSYTIGFCMLYMIFFVIQTFILKEIIEMILKQFHSQIDMAGVYSIPLITSLSDFVGSLLLIATVKLLSIKL